MGSPKQTVSGSRMRHDAQEGEMRMNTSRNANQLEQTRHSSSTMGRQTLKLLVLGVVSLLIGVNVWAARRATDGDNLGRHQYHHESRDSEQ